MLLGFRALLFVLMESVSRTVLGCPEYSLTSFPIIAKKNPFFSVE